MMIENVWSAAGASPFVAETVSGPNVPARFGEPHAAARAVEERHAQLLFESPDVLAESGLSDVFPFGGPPEVLLLGYGEEVAKLP